MFLPHIKLNNVATVANVVNVEPVRAAAAAPPSGGFLGDDPDGIPSAPQLLAVREYVAKRTATALSSAAADGFKETEYRCEETDSVEACSLWYKNVGRSLWRFFVYNPDRDSFSVVGPHYSTKSELLGDLERYAHEYGFPAPPSGGFLEPAADASLPIATLGTGFFRAGLRGRARFQEMRTVFLGSPGKEIKTQIPEYVVTLTGSTAERQHCQAGRDFEFVDSLRPSAYQLQCGHIERHDSERGSDENVVTVLHGENGVFHVRQSMRNPSERCHLVSESFVDIGEARTLYDRLTESKPIEPAAAAPPSGGFLAEPQTVEPDKNDTMALSGDDDTFDDFERRESAVVVFGRQLEASRVATIQDVCYKIEPAETGGFTIAITGADGFTEQITSGRYGFAFDTFGRTVSYAVQRARGNFVTIAETVCDNGARVERRYHNRRGVWVYVVTLPEHLSGAKFKTMETKAKRNGGWYAREFKPEFQSGGFMFPDMHDALAFARQYRPSGKVATMPRNEPPSGGFLADDAETAEQAERADAETRLERLPPRSGMSAAKWIVNGFAGTGGPPTVFDRKSDAIDWAIANKKAVSARLERERKAAEPMRGEFLSDGVKIRFNPTGNSSQHYGECESCKSLSGAEYWIASGPKSTAFYCQPCTLRLQSHMDLQPLPIPADLPTFGDTVQTPDGIVGTMRGSGGMGSDRVGVVDAAGKLQTWANRSELQRVETATAVKPRSAYADAMAQKIEKSADAMQSAIDFKTRPLTQNWTHKRGEQYASRMHDGENLQRCQAALRFLASLWRADNVPDGLRTLSTKSEVLKLVSEYRERENGRPFVGDERYHTNTETAKQLRALMTPVADPARELRKKLDAAEAKLRTCCDGVPGFFPTPPALAAKVIEAAEIPVSPSADFFVLEPSAGIGSLCDAVAQDCPALKERIDAVETWGPAADVIELKGFGHVFRDDFLSINPDRFGQLYDRIVMNPPFESLADIEHVRHAYKFLKPGGRLVAVMSDGSFFSTTRSKVTDFRDWLDSCDAEFVRTDDDSETFRGAFTGATAFRQTGVNVRIVVIDKPA